MSNKAGGRGERTDYQAYLLRLWRVNEGEDGWQVSLESIHTGERRGFSGLEAMFNYLRRKMVGPTRAAREEDEGGETPEGKERRVLSSLWRRSWARIRESRKEQERWEAEGCRSGLG